MDYCLTVKFVIGIDLQNIILTKNLKLPNNGNSKYNTLNFIIVAL